MSWFTATKKVEKFEVFLLPQEVQKQVGNLTTTRVVQQMVCIRQDGKQQHWGYCATDPARATFLPLSGFPMELVGEVQRQINLLNKYEAGEGPEPPVMLASGRTAAEQDADNAEAEDDFDDE